MPKRKRSDYERPSLESDIPIDGSGEGEEEEGGGEESTRSIAIHQKTIEQKIHHSRTLLRRALKTAKGFEQQKLGKRIKSARKGSSSSSSNQPKSKPKSKPTKDGKTPPDPADEVDRLEKEIDALKQVDLDALAARHLNKVLSKNRTLYNSRYFPPAIVREVEEASKAVVPTGAMANVCARMLNANPVKESMKEIIGNLGRILGVDEAAEDSAKPRKEKEVEIPEKKPKAVVHGTDNKSKSNDSLIEEEDGEDDSEADSQDDSEDAVTHPSMLKSLAAKYLRSGGDISSDESDDLDGRIASSSEGEDDEEEDDISDSADDRPRGRSMSITPIPEDQLREIEALEDEEFDIDLSDEGEEEEEEAPPRKKSEKQKSKKQTAPLAPPPTEPIKSSSFLPTLMAGYISGSDSDAASDTSAQNKSRKKKKGPPEKKARKNRMGQQARRALAEKKYGTGANHVKKAKEEKEAKVKAKEERQRAWEEKQTKAVHVSWELKKKQKDEKDKIVKDLMAGKGGAVGKKIVFD
ncbi:hypothetical protein TWF730_005232 [Orbilia blumenaviensis]|uniref:Bud22 domain-containing protein n=1 Tax=Orbilia blumenaviensis TaxID=1796055 RepID=A0AAV9VK48_9PEZI